MLRDVSELMLARGIEISRKAVLPLAAVQHEVLPTIEAHAFT